MLARRHQRIEAAAIDGEREGPLDVVARAHASRAQDASRRVEGEIRIGIIDRQIEMSARAVIVAHAIEADLARHPMQLAIAVGLARGRIERMVRHVEFHHAAPQLLELLAVRAHLDAGFDRRGA